MPRLEDVGCVLQAVCGEERAVSDVVLPPPPPPTPPRALNPLEQVRTKPHLRGRPTMRAELIGHFQPCMTEIYLHIDARMADYIHTHPYAARHG